MKHNLLQKKCQSCEGGVPPLGEMEAKSYMEEIPNWILSDDIKKISRSFVFRNFLVAMNFVEAVADIAEMEGHHPDIIISYNKVTLELYTHSIKGLSENDFIVAAKINQLPDFTSENLAQ